MKLIYWAVGLFLAGNCFSAALRGLHTGRLIFPSQTTFGQLLPLPTQAYEGGAAIIVSLILLAVSSPFLFFGLKCHKKKNTEKSHWGIRITFFILTLFFFVPFSKYVLGALTISERSDLYLIAALYAIPVFSSFLVIHGVNAARWTIISFLGLLSLPAVYLFAKGFAAQRNSGGTIENLSTIPTSWWMYLIGALFLITPVVGLAFLVFRAKANPHFQSVELDGVSNG